MPFSGVRLVGSMGLGTSPWAVRRIFVFNSGTALVILVIHKK